VKTQNGTQLQVGYGNTPEVRPSDHHIYSGEHTSDLSGDVSGKPSSEFKAATCPELPCSPRLGP
jgi:hypothetical protein